MRFAVAGLRHATTVLFIVLSIPPAYVLADDGIKYTAADGTIKTMSRADAEQKLSGLAESERGGKQSVAGSSAKAYFDKKGRLIKSKGGGVVDLSGGDEDELGKVAHGDAALAKFIAVGRFAQDRLNDVGLAFGNLTGLQSSPRSRLHPLEEAEMEKMKAKHANDKQGKRGDAMRARMGRKMPRQWAVSQVLTVREEVLGSDGAVTAEDRRYETAVVYDESAYAEGHSALVNAWHLEEKPPTANADQRAGGGGGDSEEEVSYVRGEAIEVPAPPRKPEFLRDFFQTNKSGFVAILGVMACSMFVKFLRTKTSKLLSGADEAGARKKTDDEKSGVAAGSSKSSGSETAAAAQNGSGLKQRKGSKKKSPKA
mmetsp:Transcript_29890/g.59981  ORF Transcript_29890/g.59981 Transcript_29890/m.59981 type:complete len:369 (-) Transcript_29890:306-1412(-)